METKRPSSGVAVPEGLQQQVEELSTAVAEARASLNDHPESSRLLTRLVALEEDLFSVLEKMGLVHYLPQFRNTHKPAAAASAAAAATAAADTTTSVSGAGGAGSDSSADDGTASRTTPTRPPTDRPESASKTPRKPLRARTPQVTVTSALVDLALAKIDNLWAAVHDIRRVVHGGPVSLGDAPTEGNLEDAWTAIRAIQGALGQAGSDLLGLSYGSPHSISRPGKPRPSSSPSRATPSANSALQEARRMQSDVSARLQAMEKRVESLAVRVEGAMSMGASLAPAPASTSSSSPEPPPAAVSTSASGAGSPAPPLATSSAGSSSPDVDLESLSRRVHLFMQISQASKSNLHKLTAQVAANAAEAKEEHRRLADTIRRVEATVARQLRIMKQQQDAQTLQQDSALLKPAGVAIASPGTRYAAMRQGAAESSFRWALQQIKSRVRSSSPVPGEGTPLPNGATAVSGTTASADGPTSSANPSIGSHDPTSADAVPPAASDPAPVLSSDPRNGGTGESNTGKPTLVQPAGTGSPVARARTDVSLDSIPTLPEHSTVPGKATAPAPSSSSAPELPSASAKGLQQQIVVVQSALDEVKESLSKFSGVKTSLSHVQDTVSDVTRFAALIGRSLASMVGVESSRAASVASKDGLIKLAELVLSQANPKANAVDLHNLRSEVAGIYSKLSGSTPGDGGGTSGSAGSSDVWSPQLRAALDRKADLADLERFATVSEVTTKASKEDVTRIFAVLSQLVSRTSELEQDATESALFVGKQMMAFKCLSCDQHVPRPSPEGRSLPTASMPNPGASTLPRRLYGASSSRRTASSPGGRPKSSSGTSKATGSPSHHPVSSVLSATGTPRSSDMV